MADTLKMKAAAAKKKADEAAAEAAEAEAAADREEAEEPEKIAAGGPSRIERNLLDEVNQIRTHLGLNKKEHEDPSMMAADPDAKVDKKTGKVPQRCFCPFCL